MRDLPASSLPASIRVIVSEMPTSGATNMAVDAVLLDSALHRGINTLRWYQWNEPTLSLGYFQQAEDPIIDQRFSTLARVRRLSGGGAILHDRELTYSCALCADHPLARTPGRLYQSIHAAIIAVLREMGANVQVRGSGSRELDANFLCFSRGDANDLVLDGLKVLGSAQRRRRGAVLQHGSLLLSPSAHAPEYPGISELIDHPLPADLRDRLVYATTGVLGMQGVCGTLTGDEEQQVAETMDSFRL